VYLVLFNHLGFVEDLERVVVSGTPLPCEEDTAVSALGQRLDHLKVL